MRNMFLTFLIWLVCSTLLYGLAVLCNLGPELGKQLAAIPTMGIKDIYGFLQSRTTRIALAGPGSDQITLLRSYSIKSWLLFVFAVLMFISVFQLSGFVNGFVDNFGSSFLGALNASIAQASGTATIQSKSTLNFSSSTVPLSVIFVTYVGRWVGTRAASGPMAYLIAVFALIIGSIIDSAATILLISDAAFEEFAGQPRTPAVIHGIIIELVLFIIMYVVVVVVAVAFGRRRRLSSYFSYVLGLLDSADRQTIVSLASEEAARVSQRESSSGAASRTVRVQTEGGRAE